jgi:hypothetical protein
MGFHDLCHEGVLWCLNLHQALIYTQNATLSALSRNHMEELMLKIQDKLGDRPARVMILVLPSDVWEARLVYERPEVGG